MAKIVKKKQRKVIRGSKGDRGAGRPSKLRTILLDRLEKFSHQYLMSYEDVVKYKIRRADRAYREAMQRYAELQRLLPTLFADVLQDDTIDTRKEFVYIRVPLHLVGEHAWRGDVLREKPKSAAKALKPSEDDDNF